MAHKFYHGTGALGTHRVVGLVGPKGRSGRYGEENPDSLTVRTNQKQESRLLGCGAV
jgi:hypothetical protein